MRPVLWSRNAKRDLARIIDYIWERNPSAALKLLNGIEKQVASLPQTPTLYRTGRKRGTRELVVHPNYVVVYRVGSSAIEVLAVLHARQQYP